MKKVYLLVFVGALLLANSSEETLSETLTSNKYLQNIRLYGAGEKVSDISYSGIGIKYDSDYSEFAVEKSDDYKRASIIQRIDINKKYYTKLGFACLEKDEVISTVIKGITQTTIGGALGYGDDRNYNLEFGYITNKLTHRDLEDTTTKVLYTEGVLKYDIGNYGSIDGTLSYQNANAYDKTISDYTASLGYYPLENNKLWAKYNSIEHDEDDYKIMSGLNYKFDGFTNLIAGTFSPYLSFSSNISKNTEVSFDYKKGISNRSLKIRDTFEKQINTSSILAKNINSEEFEKINH
ncbi:hypothetical protein [Poseidonibacter antarcticus]|uniref:hypothetical protein n=1 Tax=Poseidonibacter antarcticus TaxID=2478538 RepID=UPI000EF50FEE|nr:hypothetical protein [Poseidonibacter antarcticus]